MNDSPLHNWIPYKLANNEGQWKCRWLNSFREPFIEPFFVETITKLKAIGSGYLSLSSVSELAMLEEWADQDESLEPSAFIFHISRCGSTLITQLLATSEENIVLSEVPFFDDLLRLPYQDNRFNQTSVSNFVRAAISYYGQKRIGEEQHLFIKTDSWHIFFYEQLKKLYPKVPFILMYRRPEEVFNSQKRMPGMHAVPGLIEPEVFGFKREEVVSNNQELYLSKVLESYLNKYHQIIETDKQALLINYSEGAMTIVEKIAAFVNTPVSRQSLAIMERRSHYHSKKPNETFSEINSQYVPECLNKAIELYNALEEKRMAIY